MSWLMAALYDRAMHGVEEASLIRWRTDLLRDLSGDVLEIGAGTGANLPFYPPAVRRLVLVEPDPHMRRRLRHRHPVGAPALEIRPERLETLDLPPASFDAVVATLVFCSVPDQAAALGHVRELLRPGGRLVFLEHVAADRDPQAQKWQRRLDPVWWRVAGGCRLTRRTEEAIREAGFTIERIEREPMGKAPRVVRATVRGIARKPWDAVVPAPTTAAAGGEPR
jgi:SAM-dependent methyltransferase